MMFYGTNIINVIKQKNRVKLWQTCVKGHSISPHLNELHMIQCTCWKADLNCGICRGVSLSRFRAHSCILLPPRG